MLCYLSKLIDLILVEREGFEPPEPITQSFGFQDQRNKPLCHLSILIFVAREGLEPYDSGLKIQRFAN